MTDDQPGMKRGVAAYHRESFTDDETPVSLSCSVHVRNNFHTTYKRMLRNPRNWVHLNRTFDYLKLWGHEMYRDAVWNGVKEYWKSLGEGHVAEAFEAEHITKNGNWRFGVIPYGRPLDNQALECSNHHVVKEPLRNAQRAATAAANVAAAAAVSEFGQGVQSGVQL